MKERISLDNLGIEIKKKRKNQGIRETSKEIGISPATLSRVENGKLPDLDTFRKICNWLNIDGGTILGCSKSADKESPPLQSLSVHLKADKNLSPKVADALANMIISSQKMLASK